VAGLRAPECELAEKAIAEALRATGIPLRGKGYCALPEENLIEAVTPELWAAAKVDLEAGKGAELGGKFLAAYSSSALVVNTFIPMGHGVDIPGFGLIAGTPRLEQERSAGTRGYKPTLDVIVEGSDVDLFIESKCREYLDAGEADFSVAWPTHAAMRLTADAARVYGDLYSGNRSYRPVDAPQLLKDVLAADKWASDHGRPVLMVYAYWEPHDAARYEIFETHRKRALELFAPLSSDRVTALAISYQDLWDHWQRVGQTHIEQLRARYDVLLGPAGSGSQRMK
jgi:hypothetical protein